MSLCYCSHCLLGAIPIPSPGGRAVPSTYRQSKQFEKQWILDIQKIHQGLVKLWASLLIVISWSKHKYKLVKERSDPIPFILSYAVLFSPEAHPPAKGRCENLQVTQLCIFTVLFSTAMAIILIHWEHLQPSANLTLLPDWCDVLVL